MQHLISLATIKYGMLNHDASKVCCMAFFTIDTQTVCAWSQDIVFIMEEWAAKTGNTGPYLL